MYNLILNLVVHNLNAKQTKSRQIVAQLCKARAEIIHPVYNKQCTFSQLLSSNSAAHFKIHDGNVQFFSSC